MYAPRPRWYRPFGPLCRCSLARLSARIAVSAAARRHVARTCPVNYEIVPNGIDGRPSRATGHVAAGGGFSSSAGPSLARVSPSFWRRSGGCRRRRRSSSWASTRALERTGVRLSPPLAGRIRPRGRVDDEVRTRLLAESDLLCAPSIEGESFGVVLVEAMAAGLPVVASAIPGYAEILPPGCGRLVAPGDAGALAAALEELLGDPELRARMGAAGRKEARRYDWTSVVEDVLEIYRRALGRPPHRSASAGDWRARVASGSRGIDEPPAHGDLEELGESRHPGGSSRVSPASLAPRASAPALDGKPSGMVAVLSETAFTVRDNGVHTAFLEQVRALLCGDWLPCCFRKRRQENRPPQELGRSHSGQ
jgi:hypothetical protein